jgi:hypothetical protein
MKAFTLGFLVLAFAALQAQQPKVSGTQFNS